ncbi:replication initiation protein RepM [Moraxella bovoculi]|uniref:replication initiation protein RepM n=1 Tax=Moraxella bovoculi TaxID=386891 RepID=UPI000E35EC56|nr:replication initiation protein RepM [Moraxella bovoculi]AXR99070.1 replication initiation protein [Moraxella bovoculi]
MGSLIVKDNALVEASHKLGEVEQRLILLAILKAREVGDTVEQLRGKELIIHADDYAKTFGISQQMAYHALKKAVMGLFEAKWGYKYINDKGNKVVRYERFTQSAQYVEGEGLVSFKFADAIIPMLVELERRFTSYEIEQVAQLSSQYAMRLYEFFVRHLDKKTGTGWLDISLDDLRFRFGLLPNEYKTMSNFKAYVLDFSLKQINEYTDLSATYTQKKQGRKIVGFTFTFKAKTKSKKTPKPPLERDTNTFDMLAPISMTDKQRQMFATKLAELSELGEYAPSGASYQEYAKKIEKELLDREKAEFYRPYLEKLGFKA